MPHELTKKERKRIVFFGLIVPALMGRSFSLIQGKAITKLQRKMLVLGSAATPIFDDFFDDKNLNIENLKKIISTTNEPYQPIHFKEKIFAALWNEMIKNVADKKDFLTVTNKLIDVQSVGFNQYHIHSNYDELKNICFNKGAASTLSYWFLIHSENDGAKNKVVEQMGKLYQFLDDILDIWFDNNDQHFTVATNCKSISKLKLDWQKELQLLNNYTLALSIHKNKKNDFLQLQNLLLSVGNVAIEQLENLPTNSDYFLPSNYTRKQLVCDMELWSNRKKWFYYFSKNKMVTQF
ncbi:MAG: hypothetical protein RL708_458 [Bacteroidota bacterium]